MLAVDVQKRLQQRPAHVPVVDLADLLLNGLDLVGQLGKVFAGEAGREDLHRVPQALGGDPHVVQFVHPRGVADVGRELVQFLQPRVQHERGVGAERRRRVDGVQGKSLSHDDCAPPSRRPAACRNP